MGRPILKALVRGLCPLLFIGKKKAFDVAFIRGGCVQCTNYFEYFFFLSNFKYKKKVKNKKNFFDHFDSRFVIIYLTCIRYTH
jgi:hypothetical protein